jgi:hypothetical protein
VEDASGAALRDPNRWSDVTFESYGRLTHEDDGAEIRAAITGLESESLDFVALLKYLERSREESFVVPDAADTKQGIETTSVIGVQVYVNSKNERSVWRPQWTHGGKYERAGIMISADFWGSENVERLGLSPSWLRSSLLIDMSRDAAGRISGGVRLFPFPFGGPPGNDGEAASAKLKKLREEKQLPSDLRIDFTNGIGRRTWSRSGAGQALSAAECEQLTALFDALVETGKKVSGTDSK